MPSATGCSGAPLLRKLGYRDGMTALFIGLPEALAPALLAPAFAARYRLGGDEPAPAALPPLDIVHLFTTERGLLQARLPELRRRLAPAGMLWVSWPKRAAKLPTDLTENVVRDLALPLGLVDVKVCAVDAVWSGLKLVIRKALRA